MVQKDSTDAKAHSNGVALSHKQNVQGIHLSKSTVIVSWGQQMAVNFRRSPF